MLCLHRLQERLVVRLPSTVHQLAIQKWKGSRARRSLILTCLCSLSYMIWRTHNEAVWQFLMNNIDTIIKKIIHDVRIRLVSLYPLESYQSWFLDLFDCYVYI